MKRSYSVSARARSAALHARRVVRAAVWTALVASLTLFARSWLARDEVHLETKCGAELVAVSSEGALLLSRRAVEARGLHTGLHYTHGPCEALGLTDRVEPLSTSGRNAEYRVYTTRWKFLGFGSQVAHNVTKGLVLAHDRAGHAVVRRFTSVSPNDTRFLFVPLWPVCLATAAWPVATTISRIRRRTRMRRRQCVGCGYDLRASKDRCPECGAPIPQSGANVPPTAS